MTELENTQAAYLQFLDDIKGTIQKTQVRVARAANQELIRLYWQIGQSIVEKQDALGWGKSVVEQLAKDLTESFAGRRGFSARNL